MSHMKLTLAAMPSALDLFRVQQRRLRESGDQNRGAAFTAAKTALTRYGRTPEIFTQLAVTPGSSNPATAYGLVFTAVKTTAAAAHALVQNFDRARNITPTRKRWRAALDATPDAKEKLAAIANFVVTPRQPSSAPFAHRVDTVLPILREFAKYRF